LGYPIFQRRKISPALIVQCLVGQPLHDMIGQISGTILISNILGHQYVLIARVGRIVNTCRAITKRILSRQQIHQRDVANPVTYSAKQALLLQDEEELRLVMHQGVMQRYSVVEKSLNTIEFEQFVFDLSGVLGKTQNRSVRTLEHFISELLNPEEIIANGGKYSVAAYTAEAHQKLALPLLGLVLPIYAFAMLMTANYKRTGLGLRIAMTGGSGVFIVGLTLMIKTWVIANPGMFLFSYAPPLLCLFLALLVLSKNRVRRTLFQLPARA